MLILSGYLHVNQLIAAAETIEKATQLEHLGSWINSRMQSPVLPWIWTYCFPILKSICSFLGGGADKQSCQCHTHSEGDICARRFHPSIVWAALIAHLRSCRKGPFTHAFRRQGNGAACLFRPLTKRLCFWGSEPLFGGCSCFLALVLLCFREEKK